MIVSIFSYHNLLVNSHSLYSLGYIVASGCTANAVIDAVACNEQFLYAEPYEIIKIYLCKTVTAPFTEIYDIVYICYVLHLLLFTWKTEHL